ncbi:MAG: riboflavin biosynthesis protein RibF [Solirubrobacterales bacterium]
MIQVTPFEEARARPRRIAIGTFDGVHIGHRAVIEGADTVLTFEPHPLEVLHPAAAPKLLMPFEIKRDVLDGIGVRELVVIGFDRDFTKTSATQFIEEMLIGKLGAESVSVGENFRFGTGAKGNPAMLAGRSEFQTRIVPMVKESGETVSSSRIRELIATGRMNEARACLGVPFMLEGKVVEGERRGRELGYPTANLVPDERFAIPGHGVYAAFANGMPAAVSIGLRPTFESELGVLVEVHLLDQDVDLYGQTLRVAFVERLREEERFDSREELIAQMDLDVKKTARVCGSFQRP